jgi:glucose-6-phosphate isomerase, archaeal
MSEPMALDPHSFGSLSFDTGIGITPEADSLSFCFAPGVFGPTPEFRSLNAIRPSLLDPNVCGPDPVYGIAMDVGREEDRGELTRRWLLFGLVAFAAGRLGREPVRSQGHVHAIAPHSGWSPPELFELWQGRAIVYAQERTGQDPGRCFAIEAGPGEHVLVPPGWMHFVANADPEQPMVFAALCDRQYGFVYDEVRARGGPAWFPVFDGGVLRWEPNAAYAPSTLHVGNTRTYPEFHLRAGVPLYQQFVADPEALQWVSDPARMTAQWEGFNPLGAVSAVYTS